MRRPASPVMLCLAVTCAGLAQADTVQMTRFDCGNIRRDGDVLELDRTTTQGPVTTVFHCSGASCMNRTRIQTDDGKVSEVFRHIHISRDGSEYVSSWAMWREGEDRPEMHRTKVYYFIGCK